MNPLNPAAIALLNMRQVWLFVLAPLPSACSHSPIVAINNSELVTAVVDCISESNVAAEIYSGISGWDTYKVASIKDMFYNARAFDSDIGSWDTSRVTNMEWMFHEATAFNQDTDDWDTSKVASMEEVFSEATFNQGPGGWDTSKVIEYSREQVTAQDSVLEDAAHEVDAANVVPVRCRKSHTSDKVQAPKRLDPRVSIHTNRSEESNIASRGYSYRNRAFQSDSVKPVIPKVIQNEYAVLIGQFLLFR